MKEYREKAKDEATKPAYSGPERRKHDRAINRTLGTDRPISEKQWKEGVRQDNNSRSIQRIPQKGIDAILDKINRKDR